MKDIFETKSFAKKPSSIQVFFRYWKEDIEYRWLAISNKKVKYCKTEESFRKFWNISIWKSYIRFIRALFYPIDLLYKTIGRKLWRLEYKGYILYLKFKAIFNKDVLLKPDLELLDSINIFYSSEEEKKCNYINNYRYPLTGFKYDNNVDCDHQHELVITYYEDKTISYTCKKCKTLFN